MVESPGPDILHNPVGDDVVDNKFDAELYKNSDRMSISIADDGTYTVTVKGLNSLTVK